MSDNSNTGDWNTGDWNTGDRNTGGRNTGDRNAGDRNTGDRNAGDWNAGSWNAGDRNAGSWNAGSWNAGSWNAGDRNAGFMNTSEPKIRIFNKETNVPIGEIVFPDFFYFDLTECVYPDDMTEKQKEDHPLFEATNGILITHDYKEAFKKSWKKASDEDRKKLFELPNFDADIFKEISGIDVMTEQEKTISFMGKKFLASDIEKALSSITPVGQE